MKTALLAAILTLLLIFSLSAYYFWNENQERTDAHLKIGAYYYIWYGIPQTYNCLACPDHWTESVKGTPSQKYYSSDNATVADIHIQEALDHSVDFFAVSWFGRNSLVDHDYVNTNLQNGLLKAEHLSNFSFCLMYESKGIFDSVKDYWSKYNNTIDPPSYFRDTIIKDVDYAADHYLNNPSYLHIQGQPVLFVYNLLNLPYYYPELNATFMESIVDGIRSGLLTNKSLNIYLVGDVGSYPPPSDSPLLYSMNATTSYFFSDPRKSWMQICDDARTRFPQWRQTVNSQGIKFIPNAYPGFNSTGLSDSDPATLVLNETGFKQLLSIGKEYADPDPGIVMVTSWNEWREGTSIEPSEENDSTFLEAIPEQT